MFLRKSIEKDGPGWRPKKGVKKTTSHVVEYPQSANALFFYQTALL